MIICLLNAHRRWKWKPLLLSSQFIWLCLHMILINPQHKESFLHCAAVKFGFDYTSYFVELKFDYISLFAHRPLHMNKKQLTSDTDAWFSVSPTISPGLFCIFCYLIGITVVPLLCVWNFSASETTRSSVKLIHKFIKTP